MIASGDRETEMDIKEYAAIIQPTDEERWRAEGISAMDRLSQAENRYDGPIPRGLLADIKAQSQWERRNS